MLFGIPGEAGFDDHLMSYENGRLDLIYLEVHIRFHIVVCPSSNHVHASCVVMPSLHFSQLMRDDIRFIGWQL